MGGNFLDPTSLATGGLMQNNSADPMFGQTPIDISKIKQAPTLNMFDAANKYMPSSYSSDKPIYDPTAILNAYESHVPQFAQAMQAPAQNLANQAQYQQNVANATQWNAAIQKAQPGGTGFNAAGLLTGGDPMGAQLLGSLTKK